MVEDTTKIILYRVLTSSFNAGPPALNLSEAMLQTNVGFGPVFVFNPLKTKLCVLYQHSVRTAL
jgi:hypothetical protein